MDHLFIALVLCSALLHAVWNAFLHVSEDRLAQLGTMSLPYLAFGIAGAWLLPAPERAAWPYVGASAALEVAYCFTLARAYRSGEFGQIYPIARGLSPLLVSVLAFAALHERPTPFGFAGIVLVSFGIMSLALRRGFRFSGESVPYALLTGVFIAAYSICDGIGARVAGSALGYVAWVYLLWSVPQILLVCAVRGGPRGVFGSRDAVRQGVVAGTISLVAYGIVVLAYRHLPVATVSALRETSSIFAVAIGWFAMRERPGPQRLVACALVVAGAALIRL
ncbi:multidrug DMT transporter permease [Burkholderia ubonensis]|uniref:Multidrug DMT transporter permease n=1 Tax=Burkholderia ubonensis TaxID=101571 RepID=A0AB73FUH5_9BURK|nr:DMT family transporter [Burkholderia ubonensis]KVK80514.1 multidrug DMT transporter permease [Burkholderia ubonensis]KVL67124.1 multidrug DMT transporter permease [Burkholderia ubonensis]KVM24846.1 multidrug DMT transporter permease [Burkholderia ubonensis]KVM41584.1 multidrug DMT transporter permease [Burkholderia ubonensis]KWK85925.1 multidrug DMT transporter permease [Burkholderia ubonensis]